MDLKVDRNALDTTETHHYWKAWEKEIWQITWANPEQPGVPADPVKNEACGLTIPAAECLSPEMKTRSTFQTFLCKEGASCWGQYCV